jgi:hypothetical protein
MDLHGLPGGFLDNAVRALKTTTDYYYPWVEPAIFTVFAFVNSLRIFAYMPQVLKVLRDQHGARAISDTTWTLFLASNVTTCLYAVFSLGDAIMAMLFAGNACACVAILGATYYKRRAYRRTVTPAE